MKKTWIIDPGHGGLNSEGVYQTEGKQFQHKDFTIYEGEVNRRLAKLLVEKLKRAKIKYFLTASTSDDIPLKRRVENANFLERKYGNTVFLSLHSNAGGGKGFEIFTSKGQTKSDIIASKFGKLLSRLRYNSKESIPFRSDFRDNDIDKEAQYFVLRKTLGNALLLETLFFDDLEDAEHLMDDDFLEKVAKVLFNAIKVIEKGNE